MDVRFWQHRLCTVYGKNSSRQKVINCLSILRRKSISVSGDDWCCFARWTLGGDCSLQDGHGAVGDRVDWSQNSKNNSHRLLQIRRWQRPQHSIKPPMRCRRQRRPSANESSSRWQQRLRADETRSRRQQRSHETMKLARGYNSDKNRWRPESTSGSSTSPYSDQSGEKERHLKPTRWFESMATFPPQRIKTSVVPNRFGELHGVCMSPDNHFLMIQASYVHSSHIFIRTTRWRLKIYV
jgi:hypothetical protein